jgi:hypothetical protein
MESPRDILRSHLFEAAAMSDVWYHGDSNKRSRFDDQKMDRDMHVDANAMGPGIYWTKDRPQAYGYASPNGYVYTAQIKTNKLVKDNTPVNRDRVAKLILECDAEGLLYGLSNWGEDYEKGKQSRAYQDAIKAYVDYNESMIDAALTIYHDFFGRSDANEWTRAMIKIGYDGFLHKLPATYHLIVYNPKVIHVVSEDKFEPGKR